MKKVNIGKEMVFRKEARGNVGSRMEEKQGWSGRRRQKNELGGKSIDRIEREIIEPEKMSQIREGTEVKEQVVEKDKERKNDLISKKRIRREMSKEGVKKGQSREQDMELGQKGMNRRNNPVSIEK